jgi:hypothetical protein
LGSATDGTAVPTHGDSLGLGHDVLEELDRALELPAVDGLSGLAGVLEGDTEVGTAGAGRLRRLDLSRSVSDLIDEERRSAFRIAIRRSSPTLPTQIWGRKASQN